LKQAEDTLAEALLEEERKGQELRRCPHCGRLFSILQLNCGNFVCGRDAHENIGKELYGCGHAFNANGAPHYTADDTILAPLRAKVATESSHLHQCRGGAQLMKGAQNMDVPVLLHLIEKDDNDELFVPTSVMMDAMINYPDTPEAETPAIVMRILFEERANVERYLFLPDFIEVRIIHDNVLSLFSMAW